MGGTDEEKHKLNRVRRGTFNFTIVLKYTTVFIFDYLTIQTLRPTSSYLQNYKYPNTEIQIHAPGCCQGTAGGELERWSEVQHGRNHPLLEVPGHIVGLLGQVDRDAPASHHHGHHHVDDNSSSSSSSQVMGG